MPDQPPLWSHAGIELRWRADSIQKPNALYVGRIYVGGISAPRPGDDETQWRAWLVTDDVEGTKLYRATEGEARDSLVDEAVKALMGENNGG